MLGVFFGVCVLCISGVLCVVCVCGVVGGGGYVIDIFLALCSAGIYILHVFVFGPGTSIVFMLLFSYISIMCLIVFSFSTLVRCMGLFSKRRGSDLGSASPDPPKNCHEASGCPGCFQGVPPGPVTVQLPPGAMAVTGVFA